MSRERLVFLLSEICKSCVRSFVCNGMGGTVKGLQGTAKKAVTNEKLIRGSFFVVNFFTSHFFVRERIRFLG